MGPQSLIQLLLHTVNEKHKSGEREGEAQRSPPSSAPTCSLPLSVQSDWSRFRGWVEERHLIGLLGVGGGLSVAAGWWREAGRREVRRCKLTLSLKGVTFMSHVHSHVHGE